MAVSRGIPMETAVFMHWNSGVTLPAMVPSARVALFLTTVTSCPPRVYVPSGFPVARILSLMRTTRFSKSRKVARTTGAEMSVANQLYIAVRRVGCRADDAAVPVVERRHGVI